MDHANLLDVLMSLQISHAILPCAMQRHIRQTICIDSSGYASEPIRRCLFIDYIIIVFIYIQSGKTVWIMFWICTASKTGYIQIHIGLDKQNFSA